jgi:glutamine synthetase
LEAGYDGDGAPQPAASPRNGRPEAAGKVLSLDKVDEFGPVIFAIEAACKAQNLPTSTMISEYGPGQFEINLEHCGDLVKACDDAVLLRRCITSVARANGLDATFMSVPFAGQSGSGMHIHASLADETGNLFDPAHKDSDTELSSKTSKNQLSRTIRKRNCQSAFWSNSLSACGGPFSVPELPW